MAILRGSSGSATYFAVRSRPGGLQLMACRAAPWTLAPLDLHMSSRARLRRLLGSLTSLVRTEEMA
jgi:hypothetical protein